MRAPQPRVRPPLRVRRSAHGEGDSRPDGPSRSAAASSGAGSPSDEPATPRRAGFVMRVAAGCSDLVLLAGLDAAAVWLTLRLTGLDAQSIGVLPLPPLAVFLCLLDGGYVIALTAAGGQTLGKMAWGLRVADAAGGPVSVPQAVVRTLWIPASLTVGVLWMCLDREGRVLHDVLAGTCVLAVSPALHEPRPEGRTA